MLVLVRHAMPAFGPDIPAHEWALSEPAQAEAAELTRLLPSSAVLIGSAEPKAYQTLEPAGTVLRDERFNEVWRHGEPWDGNFLELRRAYVDGIDHANWEPRDQAASRFESGITDHLTRAAGRPIVVASHGMAMTIWLTERIGLRDPGRFWAGLQFPDAHAVDLQRCTITRLLP
jgi:broad specificity phosphatase PhoE